jgi:hypothetical protein
MTSGSRFVNAVASKNALAYALYPILSMLKNIAPLPGSSWEIPYAK